MSKGQTLRALVKERLAAAAEDIFVVFERTIAEYEEELGRSKEENQKKQQLLDKVLSPRIELVRGNVQIPTSSPGPTLRQASTETPRFKEEPEEQSVKQEEDQLPVCAVCVKTEESSLLQQRQTEHREETQGEDISHSETEGHTENSSDTDLDDEDWKPALSRSAAQTETDDDGDHNNKVQTSDGRSKLSPQKKSAPETSATVHNRDISGAGRKKHQCPHCHKKFVKKILKLHIRVHTGESLYSCSICKKTFTQKSNLDQHKRTHTGEKPYSCSICKKKFTQKSNLDRHNRTHTKEKPYSCSICKKNFAHKNALNLHKRKHTGDRPYSCKVCDKTFARQSILDKHKITHTGERPFSCSICNKTFSFKSALNTHKLTHTGEKPFGCTVCKKKFARKQDRDKHKRTHTGEKPYSCSICDKKFSRKGVLDKHTKIHKGEKP